MKKITALTSLIVLSVFVFFTNTTQAEFVAGKNYVVLDKPVETQTGNQIEIGGNDKYVSLCRKCYYEILEAASIL